MQFTLLTYLSVRQQQKASARRTPSCMAARTSTVRHRGMETGISEASKRVSIFSFATQGGKQVSFHFRQRNWVQPERLRSGFLQADSQFPLASSRFGRDSIQYRGGKTHCQGRQDPSKSVSIFLRAGKLRQMSRWFPLAGFPFRGDVLYARSHAIQIKPASES
jgi:hypothetical protein